MNDKPDEKIFLDIHKIGWQKSIKWFCQHIKDMIKCYHNQHNLWNFHNDLTQLEAKMLKLMNTNDTHPIEKSINSWEYISGLVQDCGISSALALEILQFCTKPSISSKLT